MRLTSNLNLSEYKKFAIIVILANVYCLNYAQSKEPADTTKVDREYELKELIVNAPEKAKFIDSGFAIAPSQREKKTTSSGYDLLRTMQIPALRISSDNDNVSFTNGQAAKIFINGIAASTNEVKGLRPKDVTEVQVLRYPTAIEFGNAQAVVNFIVRKRKDGGYVSLAGIQQFIYNTGDYSLFSKYESKNWSYNFCAQAKYTNNDNDSTLSVDKYDFGPNNKVLLENFSNNNRHYRTYSFAAKVANVNKKGNFLVLQAGYNIFDVPVNDIEGYNIFNGDKNTFISNGNSRSSIPYFNASYLANLPHQNQIKVEASYVMSINKNNSTYNDKVSQLFNGIKEKVYQPEYTLSYTKKFKRDIIVVNLNGRFQKFHTQYSGTNNSVQNLLIQDYKNTAKWRHDFGSYLTSILMAGVDGNYITLNKQQLSKSWKPRFALTLGSNINDKNSITANINYQQGAAMWVAYNDAEVQDSQHEGVAGNQDIKPRQWWIGYLDYDFFASRIFSFNAGISYEGRRNDYVLDYYYKDGVIYNQYVNGGSYNMTSFYVSASIKLFNNKLGIAPLLLLKKYKFSGLYPVDFWFLEPSLSLNYMPDEHWNIRADVSLDHYKTYYNSSGGYINSKAQPLTLSASYNFKNLSIGLRVNPFYKTIREEYIFDSAKLNRIKTEWSEAFARYIKLTVKYTFSYGKKTRQDYINNAYERITSTR